MKTYWSGKSIGNLEGVKSPCKGSSTNKYLNLFLLINNLYYDVYNNGGCNIRNSEYYSEEISKHGTPFKKEGFIKSHFLNARLDQQKTLDKLENTMDKIIEFLQDKDMTYTPVYEINNRENDDLKVIYAHTLKGTKYEKYLAVIELNNRGYAENEEESKDSVWSTIRIWEWASFNEMNDNRFYDVEPIILN